MQRQGTWYCPTISPYYGDWAPADTPGGKRDRARAAVHEVSFKKALNAHLKIVFGTDMGGMPWTEPIAQEFSRMVGFGMAPMDAIHAATSRAAEMLDMKGEIGVVAPGAFADIVAVSGDPLKDGRNPGTRALCDARWRGFQERNHEIAAVAFDAQETRLLPSRRTCMQYVPSLYTPRTTGPLLSTNLYCGIEVIRSFGAQKRNEEKPPKCSLLSCF